MTKKNKTTIIAEPGKQELFIIREFDAPGELVFNAFIDPVLLIKWLGPKDLSMKIDKYEPRSGGTWRFIHSDKKGNEFGFHGVIHELAPPESIIRTFEFELLPEKGHVVLEAAKFEALKGDRTKVSIQSVFLSVADRDGMLQSGMEKGVNEGYDRLDMLFAEELKK